MPALTALRLALGDAARLRAHCAFRSRDKTQLDNLQHVWRECGVCRAAGQMASGTKGEARMGAEQIENFLPFPLPRSQTLLGMFCNVGALGCPAVPKAFALSAAGALKPHIPNLQPWCGAVGAGKSPILILLRNSGPRSSWGPVHLCWEHTCPPPLGTFSLHLCNFLYLFPAMSQLPWPGSMWLINNQLLLLPVCRQPCVWDSVLLSSASG